MPEAKINRMTLDKFLDDNSLDKSLLIGYYGGGNFGDELLLEILQNLAHEEAAHSIMITYKNPKDFTTYHHDFGYVPVQWKLWPLLKAWVRQKKIVVGGGGLWGLDADFKILVLSMLLFVSRLFGKKVFLLGVGYYDSTPRLGRASAWFAGKAANLILSRDKESYKNFARVSRRTFLDQDIAWYVRELDLDDYAEDVDTIERWLSVSPGTILLCIRHFKTKAANEFTAKAEALLAANQDRPFIAATLESPESYPGGQETLESWRKNYPNLQITDSRFNPVGLFAFIRKHNEQLLLVAPQFHAIITAYINHVPFVPLDYDNKVTEMLKAIGQKNMLPIGSVQTSDLQLFADRFAKGGVQR